MRRQNKIHKDEQNKQYAKRILILPRGAPHNPITYSINLAVFAAVACREHKMDIK